MGGLDARALGLLALILAVAVVGKTVPVYAASRLAQLPPRESATVAVLLNTRGLTELIALNVGLSAGLIHRDLFAVLVVMALLTTAMTGPLLSLVTRERAPEPAAAPAQDADVAGRPA